MAELKPCPFCGGEAKKVVSVAFFDGSSYGYIRCGKPYPDCCIEQIEMDMEVAIEKWNRRAEHEKPL